MTPRSLAAWAVALTPLLLPPLHPRVPAQPPADLLIAGGTVVDGGAGPPRMADVAVRGDRVTFVGDARRANIAAARTIDARGLVVMPGFIDPHTHTFEDLSSADARRRANAAYLMQGVTTVLTGNDGGGPVNVASALARWDSLGIGTNAALFTGHGSVRSAVLGASSRAPTSAELDSMSRLVARAVRDGALGLSSGLFYAPGSFARTDEVITLARAAAREGGVYDSHMRDESSYGDGLLASVREVIRIAREAGIAANISHVKALGTDVWGRSDSVIAIVRRARAEGLKVTADQYPYLASGTSLGASLLPRWSQSGGRDSLRARAADRAIRQRMLADMRENLRRRGGAASLLITSTRDSTILGETLEAIARDRAQEPVEAALVIILNADPAVASFNMTEADMDAFAAEPWVMTGSDGSAGHPRKYGTYPQAFRRWVSGFRTMTLEQFVRRSSALPAEVFGIRDRGRILPGAFADVVVLDTAAFRATAAYDAPTKLAVGVRWVLVNGRVAVEAGSPTGVPAGRALRRVR